MRDLIYIIESNGNEFKVLTDTPEFKAWFKGSKIVDANGQPLVVWHGLKQSNGYIDRINKRVLFSPTFKHFEVTGGRHSDKTQKIEPGAWFSPDPNVAQLYGLTVAPFFLRAFDPLQNEGPLVETPKGHDAVYRMRSTHTRICEAWEIAVFDQAQIRLAFDVSNQSLTRL